MALDPSIAGLFIILGTVAGSAIVTLWPYMREKKNLEEQKAAILAKPPEQRTAEENFILTKPEQTFWQAYKYRFLFGLALGVISTMAMFDSTVRGLPEDATLLQVFMTGFGLSGIFTAIAGQIRET